MHRMRTCFLDSVNKYFWPSRSVPLHLDGCIMAHAWNKRKNMSKTIFLLINTHMYSQNWPKQETDWERGSMTFSQSSYESLTTLYITPAFKRTRWMFLNSDQLEKKLIIIELKRYIRTVKTAKCFHRRKSQCIITFYKNHATIFKNNKNLYWWMFSQKEVSLICIKLSVT